MESQWLLVASWPMGGDTAVWNPRSPVQVESCLGGLDGDWGCGGC